MKIPEDLACHAETCPVCGRLLAEENMARAFINFHRHRQQPEKTACQAPASPSAVKPGQIWRFFYGPEKLTEFCLITSDPFKGSKDLDPAVRIAPLFLAPNLLELAPSDILTTSSATTLGVPVLIETWNERPVLCCQLMEYHGAVENDLLDKVISSLNSPAQVALSSAMKLFRHQEINRGSFFSDLTFKRLIEADLDVDNAVVEKYELEKHSLKLLYLKLGRLVRAVLFPEPENGLNVCESVAASIYAASEARENPFIAALYRKLTDTLGSDGELPFRVRCHEDYSLQLVHTSRKDFQLLVKMRQAATFKIAARDGVCIIQPDSTGLPASGTIDLIILEEK